MYVFGFVLGLVLAAALGQWFLRPREVDMPKKGPPNRPNPNHPPGGRERRDPLRRIADAMEDMRDSLAQIEAQMGAQPGSQAGLNLNIREVYGRSIPVAQLPPVVLKDTEKVLVSVAPKKPDGSDDTDVDVSFASSDASVGVEEQPDGRSAYVLTPGERGSAVITVSAPNYADETLSISYEPGAKGSLNLSVGSPEPD
jgi:hypothetical protein